MGRKRIEVYILTVIFLAVAVFFGTRDPENRSYLSFEAGHEKIELWNDGFGEGYVFLPSYVNLNELSVRTNRRLTLDHSPMNQGDSCEHLELDRTYEVSGIPDLSTITFLRSEGLPTLYIDTASRNMEQINADKSWKEPATLRLYSTEGELQCQDNLEYIKGRGYSSFLSHSKKPYGFRMSAEKPLLGMGAAEKWVLLANSMDDTLIRNQLVYDFAAEAGLPYSPACRSVDLYLNGCYAGVYLLSERNEIHPERVDIQKSGSFIVSVDRPWDTDLPIVQTLGGVSMRVRASDWDIEALHEIWQSVENAIRADDDVDPDTGKHLTELIDLDSWVRKYLLEEIFENPDGGRYSQYFYLDGADPEGKIHAGPVWDYDMALSNPAVYREFGDVEYRETQFNMFYVNSNPESWFYDLYQKDIFRDRLAEIYESDFLPLLEDLPEKLSCLAAETAQAARLNQIRWDTPDPGEEAEALRSFIEKRTEFLNTVWLEDRDYLLVSARYVDRNVFYALTPGEKLPDLPVYERFGWFYAGTETRVDREAPVFEEMSIELRELG